MAITSKNAGEWAELYVLISTLGEGVLYSADAHFNKSATNTFPVISIEMQKTGQPAGAEIPIKYIVDPASQTITIESEGVSASIRMSYFRRNADRFFKIISTRAGRAFPVPEITPVLNKLKNPIVKQSSSKKADIHIVIHDVMTGFENEVGLSIKSKHGQPSTLVNASGQTLFQYRITDASNPGTPTNNKQAAEDALSKNTKSPDGSVIKIGPKERVEELYKAGFGLEFVEIKKYQFRENVQIIDSSLDLILAECLKICLGESKSSVSEIVQIIAQRDPCGFKSTNANRVHDYYKYKMKRFLVDAALGMQPKQPWAGVYDASGGYIVVKETGDVVCFHLYNWNALQDYLFMNTKFETASSTSGGKKKSFNYALYYEDQNTQESMMDICLQLRFK